MRVLKEKREQINKHLGKHLSSFPSLSSCSHCILNSDASNSIGEGTYKAGGWGQCVSFFLLFLRASFSFHCSSVLTAPFLQHGFLYGLQALQYNTCSSVPHLQATAPLGVSLLRRGLSTGISLLWHGSPLGCSPVRDI